MWVSPWGEWVRVRPGDGVAWSGSSAGWDDRGPRLLSTHGAHPTAPLPSGSWCCTSTVLATGHEGLAQILSSTIKGRI